MMVDFGYSDQLFGCLTQPIAQLSGIQPRQDRTHVRNSSVGVTILALALRLG